MPTPCVVFPKESVSSIEAMFHILFIILPKLTVAKLQGLNYKSQRLRLAKLRPHCHCPKEMPRWPLYMGTRQHFSTVVPSVFIYLGHPASLIRMC